MIVDKYGRVAGSIDLAALAGLYAGTDDDELRAHYREVAAESGVDLGGGVTPADWGDQVRDGVEDREDGVHDLGGGWYEVVVGGVVVDKVRGADAAQDAYEEASDGNDNVS